MGDILKTFQFWSKGNVLHTAGIGVEATCVLSVAIYGSEVRTAQKVLSDLFSGFLAVWEGRLFCLGLRSLLLAHGRNSRYCLRKRRDPLLVQTSPH